jgi:hypothetical protein
MFGSVELSDRRRADFQPQIEPPVNLTKWFSWDGQPYYGECTIDGKRCFWIWIDSLNEEIGEWEKMRFQIRGAPWLRVERNIKGCTVFEARVMTKLQCENVDLFNKIWRENSGDRPKFMDALKAVGLPDSIFDVVDNRKDLPIVGYWFREGAEYSEETLFSDYETKIETLNAVTKDFINSLPEVID